MNPIISFTNSLISLVITSSVSLELVETGVPLELVPFRESAHAIRLVPNTAELNEFIDRTLNSIQRLPMVKLDNILPITRAYKHFTHLISNESTSGTFQTSRGVLWNSADLVRSGNAYIYNNDEDSIQVVAKLMLKSLKIKYGRYMVICGTFNQTGSVDGIVDVSSVDVEITLRVRQNDSLPLIFVCNGKVDSLSLTLGDSHFTLTGQEGDKEFDTLILNWLTDHFNNNVFPHLQQVLTSSFEIVVRRDEQLCYYLVLCNSCDFYAADS